MGFINIESKIPWPFGVKPNLDTGNGNMPRKQFNFIETEFKGVFVIEKNQFEDNRGLFIKTFHEEIFQTANISTDFKESYYSISSKNVLRGMHFQAHPHGQAKLINVIEGEVLDVIVNVDQNDPKNFGRTFSTVLSRENNKSLYIPDGYAHGFLVLSEKAIVVNNASSIYNQASDMGIRYDSFGFQWPIKNPILSARDENLLPMNDVFSENI